MCLPQDPMILLSFVNMKLRDGYASLEDFCDDYSITVEDLENRLKPIGFTYDEALMQFR